MGDSFIFQFFKKWRQVGAITPSSAYLVSDMLDNISWRDVRVVVELGAGEGSFTREILNRMSFDSKLYVFEIDPVFIKKLSNINDSRMILINGSAIDMSKYLSGVVADCVISGIPLSNIEKDVKKSLIQEIKKILKKDGLFLQFQYFPESYKILKKYFRTVSVRFTLLNTPPAFFYVCRL